MSRKIKNDIKELKSRRDELLKNPIVDEYINIEKMINLKKCELVKYKEDKINKKSKSR